MKIPILGEISLNPVREAFKGFWSKGTTAAQPRKHFYPGEHTWLARCIQYNRIVERHPLAKCIVTTIAGQVMSDGFYLEAAYNEGPHKTRAKEALDLCEELNDKINIQTLIFKTAVEMPKYGSSFWEISPQQFDVRLHPYPETLEPRQADQPADKILWRQNVNVGGYAIDYPEGLLIHFPWNVTSTTWPYGTSQLVGLEGEFEILEQLEDDIKEFMHNGAFPNELYQVGDGKFMPQPDEVTSIRSDVRNWKPGEKFVTSYPIAKVSGGTGDRTISNLNEVLDFVYNHIIDGGGIPPISKQWNATNASAEEMMPWARANLIQPIQRIIEETIREYLYKPYLMMRGYSVKVCPRGKWESPDAHKDEEAEYWALQVQSGIVPAEYAAEAQGFDMDKIQSMKQREMEQMELQQDNLQNPKVAVKKDVDSS